MHGQPLPHNPLAAAAKETLAVAREAKSPLFERVAMITLMASAAVTTAVGALQAWHMLRRDLDDKHREKDKERGRRSDPSPPPPDRPGYGGTAAAGMPYHDRGDGEGRQ